MKAFPQLHLLLAFSACVSSALGIHSASTHLQKPQFSRDRSGEISDTGSDDRSVILSRHTPSNGSNSTVHSNCSCALLGPGDCVAECGYFGYGSTYPKSGEPYELIPNNGFYRGGNYDWPEPLNSTFYHSGGAQQSYIATGKDDNPYFDYPPKQLNSSQAAQVYPGNWPDVVYAWWFLFSSTSADHPDGKTRKYQPVSCLCEATKECGCAPAGWTTVEAFTNIYAYDAVITSKSIHADWIVNGTATVRDLEEQSKLREKKKKEAAEREEADESGAPKKLGGSGWSILALIAVAIFSGL